MASPPRIKVPKETRKGEVIEIRTLISHVMDNGLRKDATGNIIPRRIINTFTCEFNGMPVFTAMLEPAIAANPFLQFTARVDESGTFKFTWIDDNGMVTTAEAGITVV